MPLRSLSTSVHRWPRTEEVLEKTRAWAKELARNCPPVSRVGLFGSYARGEAGVGSDLDIIIIVDQDGRPFERRTLGDSTKLPLGADILVYTKAEWRQLQERGGRFAEMLQEETLWLVCR